MTDQIELPTIPQSPPIVTLLGYNDDADSLILFDRKGRNELIVNLQIRNEDLSEPLEMRWRIKSNKRPPVTPLKEYPCPEPPIVANGQLIRMASLPIQTTSLFPGSCNRIDVIVSGSFKPCKPDADDGWDITTQQDDDTDIGRLSFWVWDYETTMSPLVRSDIALELARSCEALEYKPPSGTATSTAAAVGM